MNQQKRRKEVTADLQSEGLIFCQQCHFIFFGMLRLTLIHFTYYPPEI